MLWALNSWYLYDSKNLLSWTIKLFKKGRKSVTGSYICIEMTPNYIRTYLVDIQMIYTPIFPFLLKNHKKFISDNLNFSYCSWLVSLHTNNKIQTLVWPTDHSLHNIWCTLSPWCFFPTVTSDHSEHPFTILPLFFVHLGAHGDHFHHGAICSTWNVLSPHFWIVTSSLILRSE